jgi:hypothetical protein
MTLYVPSSVAESLSLALWGLSRPPNLRQPEDTQYLFGWIAARDGSCWLVVDENYDVYIHPAAELGGLADILQPWIDAGNLPADTLTQLAALIESKRSQRLVVWGAFPQLFKDMSKTRQQMIDAGLLAQPQMPT